MSNSKAQVIKLLFSSKEAQRSYIQEVLCEAGLLNVDVLAFKPQATALWNDVAKDFSALETEYNTPFKLQEREHLYAIDALLLADALKLDTISTEVVAKVYILFFLLVSYFDDHVEHRDKFYSKFSYENTSDRSTQHGAVPFSTIFMALELVDQYLTKANATAEQKIKIFQIISKNLLSYTQFFATERSIDATIEEVFEMKQRQVSAKVVAILADLVEPFTRLSSAKKQALSNGMFYLGSMMQITDDIRDAETDKVLKNANLMNVCHHVLGEAEGAKHFTEIFENESTLAKENLEKVFEEKHVSYLMSLPFYPFCIEGKE